MGKRSLWLLVLLCTGLFGCHRQPQRMELVEIRFERGHGSSWGSQFLIVLNSREIVSLTRVSPQTRELETTEHIPITEAQWQAVVAAIPQMQPQKAKLSGNNVLDGGLYRTITLLWQDAKGRTHPVSYRWPSTEEAARLETQLEAFQNLLF